MMMERKVKRFMGLKVWLAFAYSVCGGDAHLMPRWVNNVFASERLCVQSRNLKT